MAAVNVKEMPLIQRVDRALPMLIDFIEKQHLPDNPDEALLDLVALFEATDLMKSIFCDETMLNNSSGEYLKTANMIQCFSKLQDGDCVWSLITVLLEHETDGDVDEFAKRLREYRESIQKEMDTWVQAQK